MVEEGQDDECAICAYKCTQSWHLKKVGPSQVIGIGSVCLVHVSSEESVEHQEIGMDKRRLEKVLSDIEYM